MAIAAEFKKSSPSKGDINIAVDPVTQCLEYTKGGVSVISVLTEHAHFKGTLDDMRAVRVATQQWSTSNSKPRPAILRKDFILDEWQIYESYYFGADCILLILAIIDDKKAPREELSVVENILLQYRIMIKTEKPPIIEKD